jgi:glycerol-3-phosphate O-acyltransferase
VQVPTDGVQHADTWISGLTTRTQRQRHRAPRAWRLRLSDEQLVFFAGRNEFAGELWNEVALLTGVRQEPATEVDPDKAAQWLANSSLLVS